MTDDLRKDEEMGEHDRPAASAEASEAEVTGEADAAAEAPSEPEAAGEEEPAPPAGEEPAGADEKRPETRAAEEQREWAPPPVDDLGVFDLLRASIGLFVQEAWIALGVQARPGATDVHTDLHAARVAIDTTQLLIDKLGDEATDEEKREFEQIMTNLRMNFVRRQARQG